MFSKSKWPSFEGIALIADKACFAQLGKMRYFPVLIMIILVFSFVYSALLNMLKKVFFAVYSVCRKLNMLKKIVFNFLVAFFTADNKVDLFSSGNLITGNMVKVTGIGRK